MPAGVVAGYGVDTGLDIAGSPRPVYAIAAGTLDYSEPGHTRWTGPGDDDKAVRLELDAPIPYADRRITHVWYAHLSALRRVQREGDLPRAHVAAGERLGTSGRANGSPHLHLGLLLDGDTSQRWGSYLTDEQVRQVLGGLRRGTRLPER
ncbi:MAG: peptidoglycan DD-metalloendopeptidase family protein [Myxococcales bacterium]|nr:peptidoglycan DD-metalloendopeptidase family protein [Myxococcales bacterium]